MTRRAFVAAALAAAQLKAAAGSAAIRIGITSNTRPEWSGADGFRLSLEECSELGYRWIETFWPYVQQWEENPGELIALMADLGLKMETVSNGGRMNTFFQKPDQRAEVIADHMRLVRFIKALGCDHLKINCGAPNPGGNTPEIYDEMAKTFDELGRRIREEGLKFGIHAHLWTQFETRQDVDAIMERTDPQNVYLILDTGHTSMAGMDPVKLTRDYGHRIIEYHLKDVAPENRGGYQGPPIDRTKVNTGPDDRIFFELGEGGVDFPAILAHLKEIGWQGWFTVELDRSGSTAKQSAAKSKKYIEDVLGLEV